MCHQYTIKQRASVIAMTNHKIRLQWPNNLIAINYDALIDAILNDQDRPFQGTVDDLKKQLKKLEKQRYISVFNKDNHSVVVFNQLFYRPDPPKPTSVKTQRIEHSIADLPPELDFCSPDGWPKNWSYERLKHGEWYIYRIEVDEQGNTISHVYPLPRSIGTILEHRSIWVREETQGTIRQSIKSVIGL
jgi:hypothetical protein